MLRAGNMRKARVILTGTGVSMSDTALHEMREKESAAPFLILPVPDFNT